MFQCFVYLDSVSYETIFNFKNCWEIYSRTFIRFMRLNVVDAMVVLIDDINI